MAPVRFEDVEAAIQEADADTLDAIRDTDDDRDNGRELREHRLAGILLAMRMLGE